MNFQFEMATRVHFGEGRLSMLAEEIKTLGPKRWLIATDPNMEIMGHLGKVCGLIDAQNQQSFVYDGIDREPEDLHVAEGLKILRQNNCQGIVALGGGSVLDTAKAIAVMAQNEGHIADYAGLNKIPKPKIPLIAIPTTAGTGSEVTRALGITDTRNQTKKVLVSPVLSPEVAIEDPELTYTLPRSLTAQIGIDALTHAIEAYVCRHANPISDTLAVQAIQIIGNALPHAWRNGDDTQARRQMMLGQLMAGMAVMNVGVCLVHGMGRPLGLYFDVPHGLANAILLPPVVRFSVRGNPERYAAVAAALGKSIGGLGTETAADCAISAIENLIERLEIPPLSKLGIDPEAYRTLIPKMADDSIKSGSPGNNPVVPTQNEIEQLYEALLV